MFRNRWLIALGAIAMAFVLVSADAHARVGGGFSGGSRGMRTFSAPPATSRPTARLESVRACSAAACSAGLLPASSAQVYLACCLGTDFSVAWQASPQ